jgi:hypothetical protein
VDEKTTIKISARTAACVSGNASREERLKAARCEIDISLEDIGGVLLFLSNDQDDEVKAAAIRSFREMPEETALALAGSVDTHPRILDILARLHFMKPEVARKLALHKSLPEKTLAFLMEKVAPGEPVPDIVTPPDNEAPEAGEEEVSEEFQSKYQMSMGMGVAEKIKMALTGDKEWRSLLIKDSNKLVSGGVVKNPRLTEPEVLGIVKSSLQNDEIIRVICANKEWLKNYQIRKALVENHRTPLPNALRYLAMLTEKDIAGLAKSKNVSTVIATQARRLLLNKEKHK